MRGTLIAFSQLAFLVLGSCSLSATGSRSLLHRELNLAALYSRRDASLDLHPAPLFSSVGFEYLQKFADGPPGRLNPDALDLHVQFAYNPGDDRIETRFQDVWVRFMEPVSGCRVRLGHFDLPFGLTPSAAPRGEALFPLAAFDLGFKKDWGVAVQGEWQRYAFTYETAATFGMGDEIRRRRGRYLWTGRIGMPTYRDAQYGISFLYGAIPGLDSHLQRSWRLAADIVYTYRAPFTVARGELTFGADDHTPVGGFLLALTQILPPDPRWAIEAQTRVWRVDAPSGDATRAESIAGVWRTLPALFKLRLHWRHYFPSGSFREDDRIFAQIYYYGY